MKSEYLQIRMPEEEKNDLFEVAARLPDTSASDIAREAIREKVAKLKRKLSPLSRKSEEVVAG